jgi:S-adenosylmethionine:tRNA ribosyltransferase-isomerase
MKTEQLNYYLPPEFIAQQPPPARTDSRLLVLNRPGGELIDSRFSKIDDFLLPEDCLVLNDTRVLPARFFGRRSSKGKLEGLFVAEDEPGIWQVMLKGARKLTAGQTIYLKDKSQKDLCSAQILEKSGRGVCKLKISAEQDAQTILDKIGYPPLPPYIKRGTDLHQAQIDNKRYQTVYARHTGAIAAPTAGLHFTNELIDQLKNRQVRFAYITLHIGTGTFKPITTKTVEQHKMHSERFSIDDKNAQIINAAKEQNRRIIAVGTTSARTLETVAIGSRVEAASGTTDLFIRPGYKFKMLDAMITNFHLPQSTLLALVAAFAGLDNIMRAYKHAIDIRYRFYSYGDAMLII